MSLVARTYASPDAAAAAKAKLQEYGFGAQRIQTIAPPPDGAAPGQTAASIKSAGIAPAHAALYAEAVHRGETLVVVDAPFGQGQAATNALESLHPTSLTLPDIDPIATKDSATPLSNLMGWPVLLSNPAPLSTWLRWRTTKPERRSKTLPRIQRQSRQPAPLSASVKLPVLAADPAPLSAAVRWSPLLDRAAPLSDRIGWRTLWNNPAPLSSLAGLPVLSNDSAPLSSRLGMPVLSNAPAPLSARWGLRIFSKDD